MSIINTLQRVLIVLVQQFAIIFPYWILGIFVGSLISVFCSDKIINLFAKLKGTRFMLAGVLIATLLGAASPVCMYGTIPLIASLGKKGIPQYLLAAFMITSILINPNLFIFSFALGLPIALVRLFVSILVGVIAGILIFIFYKDKSFFNYYDIEPKAKKECKKPDFKVFLSDMHRGIIKTANYFFVGILLTALFDVLIPKDVFISLFGKNDKLGVILSATLGVPLYVCGGGTIPILKAWLEMGMSAGAAISFMITGAATKITNLSAVKIILGLKNFILYIAYIMIFALLAGFATDAIYAMLERII